MTRVYEITNDTLNKIIGIAVENGVNYDIYEGTLNDSFVFYDTENHIMVKGQTSKHMIVREMSQNEWTSSLILYMTDSDEVLNRHIEELEEQYKEW